MCWHTLPSFFSVQLISQRWHPEHLALSVTIIFKGVVLMSMRPDAMERSVTPQLASTPPATRPTTPQPHMASTSRRVNTCFFLAGVSELAASAPSTSFRGMFSDASFTKGMRPLADPSFSLVIATSSLQSSIRNKRTYSYSMLHMHSMG